MLLAGFALLRMLSLGEATASRRSASPGELAPAPPSPVADKSAVATIDAVAAPRVVASRSTRPSIADSVAAPAEDDIPRRPDGGILGVADLDVLRAANTPTNELIRDCLAKHGAGVSGTLMTTFVVARKRDKSGVIAVETETTGYEEDESTIRDPALIECIHKTAFAMKFPPNTSPVATWARRSVIVKDGALDDNWITVHGYIR